MARHPTPSPIIDNIEYLHTQAIHQEDVRYAIDFLKQYAGNKATFESYRREIERLLQWTLLVEEISILKLKREEIEKYLAFCLNPPKSWIATKRVARFTLKAGQRVPNSKWRPFVVSVTKLEHKEGLAPNKLTYQLSQKAIREIFTVLSSFYNYLVLEEKVSINPISLIKQKSRYLQKQQKQGAVMRLSDRQWQTCLDTTRALAASEPEKHARSLFILSALYLLYLRISELVATERWAPQMGHFYKDSHGYWWFKTVGKGNKMRDIAVSDDMLASLKLYRKYLGLTALPLANDATPLLPKVKGKGAMSSTRHIRRLIQVCFDRAIDKLRLEGATEDANALEAATVHWLRHTGISDDINKRGRPIAHVRDDAGHSSSAITDRYNDIELKERHRSAKGKKLITEE